MGTQQDKILDANHRLQRCPYRQDLKIFCGEKDCTRAGCPIWNKESGMLAQAIQWYELI